MRHAPVPVLAIGLGLAVGVAAGFGVPAATLVAQPNPNGPTQARVHTLAAPAGNGSGMYALAASPDGRAYLSWLEPDGAAPRHALKFARLQDNGAAWSEARTVASGDDWFVNWADHPSVVPLANGALAAHWLVKAKGPGAGAHGYGLRIAQSRDEGKSWRQVFEVGTDNPSDYSGFVSILPSATSKGFLAAYLTPDAAAAGAHVKMLALARFNADGSLASNDVLDRDTCTCCTTSVVDTTDGPLIAYRDHQGQIRDISVIRLPSPGGRGGDGGGASSPQPRSVHRDGWAIDGCPTNGPTLASHGKRVAIAWFTAAKDEPHVKVAFSNDAGESFQPPSIVDGGRPVGWTGIALLDDGSAVVSWLESVDGGRGEVRVRRVSPDGMLGAPLTVATSQAGRTTGIPQIVRTKDALVIAWRADRVQTAVVPFP